MGGNGQGRSRRSHGEKSANSPSLLCTAVGVGLVAVVGLGAKRARQAGEGVARFGVGVAHLSRRYGVVLVGKCGGVVDFSARIYYRVRSCQSRKAS